MKKILLVMGIMLSLVIIAVPPAYAADTAKTAVVDFTVVINGSDAGKKANAELVELVKARQAAVEEKAQNVQSLKKALQEQAATLSAEDKKAKEEELNRVFRDYQATVAQSNGEVEKKAAELRNGVMKEIKEVLNKIAQEEKYTMILDATVVPYYDKNSDISAKVIQKYNEFKK